MILIIAFLSTTKAEEMNLENENKRIEELHKKGKLLDFEVVDTIYTKSTKYLRFVNFEHKHLWETQNNLKNYSGYEGIDSVSSLYFVYDTIYKFDILKSEKYRKEFIKQSTVAFLEMYMNYRKEKGLNIDYKVVNDNSGTSANNFRIALESNILEEIYSTTNEDKISEFAHYGAYTRIKKWGNGVENVNIMPKTTEFETPTSLARFLLEDWDKSKGHHKNLIKANITKVEFSLDYVPEMFFKPCEFNVPIFVSTMLYIID